MEHLKEWVKSHKALAIGGAIAIVILLYLLLRSGGKTAPAPADTSGVQAYYAAQAAGAGAAATSQQSTDALAAASGQTNAQQTVALAQIAASSAPYQTQLSLATLSANLTAYHDYLTELSGAGSSASGPNPTGLASTYVASSQYIPIGGDLWGRAISAAGTPVQYQGTPGTSSYVAVNYGGGAALGPGQGGASYDVSPTAQASLTYWPGGNVSGGTPQFVQPSTPAAAPLQFGQFVGVAAPTLH